MGATRWRFDFSFRFLSGRRAVTRVRPTVVGKVMRRTEQPALFIPFFFFSSSKGRITHVVRVVVSQKRREREKGKNGFCRLYRGLIAVDVTTNIVVPPLGQYRTSQERKRVVVARRIRLPILPMLIIPISIAGT